MTEENKSSCHNSNIVDGKCDVCGKVPGSEENAEAADAQTKDVETNETAEEVKTGDSEATASTEETQGENQKSEEGEKTEEEKSSEETKPESETAENQTGESEEKTA